MTGPKRVTDKQLAANRANAQLSTGPRTPEGKAAVRYNALTHGILAKAVIPDALEPYESHEAFDQLLTTLSNAFSPSNSVEELLVQQVAIIYWRLARLYRAEAGAIARRQDECAHDLARAARWAERFPSSIPSAADRIRNEHAALHAVLGSPAELRAYMEALDPGFCVVGDDGIHKAARERLAALQDRHSDLLAHRQAIEDASRSLPPVDTALQYARYEGALQRRLDRILSRLERLNRLGGGRRRGSGDAVAPARHIDVTDVDITKNKE